VRALPPLALAVLMFGSFDPGGAAASGRESSSPASSSAPLARDSIALVAPGVYAVGGVTIDSNERTVTASGRVNMDRGPIELLACAPYGKTHESVFVLDAQPYHIQVGLLLLGLEPTRRPLRYQGDPNAPKGDSVEVRISWTDSTGRQMDVRGEETVLEVRSRRSMPRTPWVFVGSRIVDGVFQAQAEGTVITTFHDPATIIDNPLIDGGDDTAYVANPVVLPPVGTAIELSIRVLGPARNTKGKTR